MTDDLNERCAMAMGWKRPSDIGRCNVCGWELVPNSKSGCHTDNCCMRPVPEKRADRFRDYLTDPATIPEMTAFLALHAFKGGWHTYSLTWQGAKAGGWQACFCRVEPDLIECGATLNEAIARLVCAVAEAKRHTTTEGRP